jgi:hypothetical protein
MKFEQINFQKKNRRPVTETTYQIDAGEWNALGMEIRRHLARLNAIDPEGIAPGDAVYVTDKDIQDRFGDAKISILTESAYADLVEHEKIDEETVYLIYGDDELEVVAGSGEVIPLSSYPTYAEMNAAIARAVSSSQGKIPDIDEIRAGAAAGATAVQDVDIAQGANGTTISVDEEEAKTIVSGTEPSDTSEKKYVAPSWEAMKESLPAKYAGSATTGGPAKSTAAIPFGKVDATSTATVFTASVPEITELKDGVCCYLMNGVVTSAANWTLNVNGLGAKPVYSTMSAAVRTTTLFNKNYTMLFVYNSTRVNGGCWDIFYGYNSDNNTIGYDIIDYNTGFKKIKTACQRYQFLLTTMDGLLLPVYSGSYTTGTTKILTTEKFNPFGQIYYYTSTAALTANAIPATGTLRTKSSYSLPYLTYAFNTGATLVAGNDIYLVCVPQDDGSAVLHTNPIAFALPTTEDGLLYKRLGKCYDTDQIVLEQDKPIYYYKDGAIRLWTNGKENVHVYKIALDRSLSGAPVGTIIPVSLNDILADLRNEIAPIVVNDISDMHGLYEQAVVSTAVSSLIGDPQVALTILLGTTQYALLCKPSTTVENALEVSESYSAEIPSPSSTTPKMDGTAAVGTSTDYARADHVHPSDTSAVHLAGAETISGVKTFSNGLKLTTADSWSSSDRTIPFSANGANDTIQYVNANANTGLTYNPNTGALKAKSFVTRGGTSAQVVRGDGSLLDALTLPQYEAYLQWGGKNFTSSYGPIDAAMVSELGACRTMFARAAGIAVEYSRDDGETWLDYEATDAQKVALFSSGTNLYIGKSSTNGASSADYMLRVSLRSGAAGIYTNLNKFVILIGTYGSTGCYCTIRCRTQQNYENNVDTWVTRADKVPISGWTGYNVINTTDITTYGNQKASQYGEIQFIFGCTKYSGSSTGLRILEIFGYGGTGWTIPSTMAKTGHLYSFDYAQNAAFPAQVAATSFKVTGGTASQFLKANGTVDSTAYAPLASPTLTGTPKAPTAAVGTNTTQIATTAFVQSAIGNIESVLDAIIGN